MLSRQVEGRWLRLLHGRNFASVFVSAAWAKICPWQRKDACAACSRRIIPSDAFLPGKSDSLA